MPTALESLHTYRISTMWTLLRLISYSFKIGCLSLCRFGYSYVISLCVLCQRQALLMQTHVSLKSGNKIYSKGEKVSTRTNMSMGYSTWKISVASDQGDRRLGK